MKTRRTIWILAIVLAILSCKNGAVGAGDSLLEKQEQKQVDRLLSSLTPAFIKSQGDKLEQLYQESQFHSNLESVRGLDIYQQILSAFKENDASGWAILFAEIAKKNSMHKANASALLSDLAFPRYQFILDELKAEDIGVSDLVIVQRLLRLETFGGNLQDPTL